MGLTKRAPNAGESAQISNIFLRLIIFLAGRLRRPRSSADNANRWVAPCRRLFCKNTIFHSRPIETNIETLKYYHPI